MNLSFDDVIPYPVLSPQFLPYHLLSLAINPSYNQDFFRTLKSPHPFEFIVWWRHSLSRAITPDPALSLFILSYYPSYNQDFFRTLKSPHPFEFIVWWRHSLSRAITQILPYHLLSLAIIHLITKIFQNSKITPPLFISLKSPHHFPSVQKHHANFMSKKTPFHQSTITRPPFENHLSKITPPLSKKTPHQFHLSKITPPLFITL